LAYPKARETLGVSVSYWGHIKAGRRKLTDDMIRRIKERIPALEGLCVAALLEKRERVA
jgi:hypothetical protein